VNFRDLDTPALIVDLDRMERNLAAMASVAQAGGKSLRPHTKTHKTPEIARLQVQHGARGITVAKVGEAEVMASHGLDDLFIANEIVGEEKIGRLLRVMETASVTCGVDSREGAEALSRAAAAKGVRAPVRVEFDSGLGRAGARSIESAIELAHTADRLPGVEFRGVFSYEGHANLLPSPQKEAECRRIGALLAELCERLRDHGLDPGDVSVGSTPCSPLMAREEVVTELRPGTYVFYDTMQAKWGARMEDCALTVLCTVVSRPDDGTAILDGGVKTFAGDRAESGSRHGTVVEDSAILFDWANEEHGHLDLRGATLRPKVGDKLRVVPQHVCTCVNMHETLHGVRGDSVEVAWRIAARGKVQ
jgi:D-serine deaminase-like pyridoxal phosphate-dependent protein